MAYIGQKGGTVSTITSKTLDTMTGDGSDTTLTLSQTPTSAEDVSIYADGVYQRPTNEYTVSGDVVTFTTAPASGVFVCAITGGGHHIGSPQAGSVSTSKIIDGTITNAMVATMSSSKLTGALPALDGSALTGLPSTITKSASDPATDTNPSGGVGTVWANTTSGDMYILTDATTDANVWTNIGAGTGDVVPFNFRGSTSGYMLGGYQWNTGYSGNIQKFNFASNTGQTSPANFPANRYGGGAGRSVTEGYYFGGTSSGPEVASFAKFTFGSESTSSSLGNLVRGGYNVGSHSTADYIYTTQSQENFESSNNIIERVATSSDTPSGDIGDMASPTLGGPCTQTETHGYTIGGLRYELPFRSNESRIEKYAFASSVTSATVADIGATTGGGGGTSSTTHGIFQHGNDVRKHQFASDSDAVAYGSFQENLGNRASASGEDHGYFMGGNRGVSNQGTTGFADIEKVSYASNTTATDWGDLPNGRYGPAGTQY